tara:strand:+ start:713 stop:928 length:216 start_codon:yes stop_codon:yes gene_type:complete
MINAEKLGTLTSHLIKSVIASIIVWLITYLVIIEIPLWKFFLIDIIYVILYKFHIFMYEKHKVLGNRKEVF